MRRLAVGSVLDMRYAAAAIIALAASLNSAAAITAEAPRAPLTAAATVETRRLMVDSASISAVNPHGAVSISPDGRTFIARVVKGIVQQDMVEMEIYAGSTESPDAASRLRSVAHFTSSGLGPERAGYLGAHLDTEAYASELRWIDNEQIAFLWSNAAGVRQIVAVNVRTGDVRWLTDHPTSIAAFDYRNGVLFFNALLGQRQSAAVDTAAGWVVPERMDAYGVLFGDLSGESTIDRRMNSQWFVKRPGDAHAKLVVVGHDPNLDVRHKVMLSANGKWAVIDASPATALESWDQYDEPSLRGWIAEMRRSVTAPGARNVHQWFLIDVDALSARPLWDAPTVATISSVAWSPTGKRLLIAPAWLPPTVSSATSVRSDGEAYAVVIEVVNGRTFTLPIALPAMRQVRSIQWLSETEVEIQSAQNHGHVRRTFRESSDGEWIEVRSSTQIGSAQLRFEIAQDLAAPPALVARSDAGEVRVLIDLNPSLLIDYDLGRVERVGGKLAEGPEWQGLLFYPPHYRKGERYPLVVQSAYGGGISDEFTLNGPQKGIGVGPTPMSIYAGQLLATRGIVVLHLNVMAGEHFNTPREATLYARAFEQVAAELGEAGLVDLTRVGLVGFSRSGFHVEYALTHSDFPFAAALTADNFDGSYFQHLVSGNVVDTAAVNGALPFGNGLEQWLVNSPGFNADRVRAPLRMVEMSHGGLPGILSKWELFSRLRYLDRPVEFFVMPKADRGSHNPQNPTQIIALQESTVDWFDFWLKGREDSRATKEEQYQRWRKLRLSACRVASIHCVAEAMHQTAIGGATTPSRDAGRSPQGMRSP
jgi:hypothetical protein